MSVSLAWPTTVPKRWPPYLRSAAKHTRDSGIVIPRSCTLCSVQEVAWCAPTVKSARHLSVRPEALAHLLGREEPLYRRESADHFRDYIENELQESVVSRYLSSMAG